MRFLNFIESPPLLWLQFLKNLYLFLSIKTSMALWKKKIIIIVTTSQHCVMVCNRKNKLIIIPFHLLTGNECVIVKNGTRICGTGAALATADVVQDKSYFEIKIQSEGRCL